MVMKWLLSDFALVVVSERFQNSHSAAVPIRCQVGCVIV